LERAEFWRTNLEGANLQSAHLKETRFSNANLKKARLVDAILEHARGLESTELEGAIASIKTKWPDGFDWVAAGVIER
jgi:uncharacterized protein YjbI with pentapeptide repeats